MIARKRLLAVSLGLALPLAVSAARAQDKPAPTPATPEPEKKDGKDETGSKEENTPEAVAVARFIETYTAQDWAKAKNAYEDGLVKLWPAYATDPQYTSFTYKYANVLFKLGDKKTAANKLRELLTIEGDNIVALWLLTSIEAASDDPAKGPKDKEDAKERLIIAAKNGFFAIRELNNAKGPEFKYMQDDPKFILDCMRASREFDVRAKIGTKAVRNPFDIPPEGIPQTKGGDKGPNVMDAKLKAQLEKDMAAIFDKIVKLAKENKVDELIPAFAELRTKMDQYRGAGKEADELLKKYEERLKEYKEVYLAVQLQVFISRGNECLKAMIKDNQAEKFEDTFEQFNQLKIVVDEMRKVDRPEFSRNADVFYIRGKNLDDEAHKLKKIKEFNLIVTGIVVDPRPEGKNKCVIVYDDPDRKGRIYQVDEDIRDREDKRVKGLKVVQILEGAIRFRYEETDFVRPLQQAKEK